jgi:hypothetical protein
MVLEEDVNPYQWLTTRLLEPGENDPNERNYRLIAELYHRLKRKYDAECDYWTAGDFHYGEMEMKRLYSSRRNKALRWLHRSLGLVACYKYASDYGESYVKPGLWLAPVLLIFALLYPVTGLDLVQSPAAPTCVTQQAPAPPVKVPPASTCSSSKSLTYRCPWPNALEQPSVWGARGHLLGNSLITSLYVAAFQRDLQYQPSYPGGRLLALAEVLLTSTLGALFLLAVRRQFKR